MRGAIMIALRLNTSLTDGDLSFAANDDALIANKAYQGDYDSFETLFEQCSLNRHKAGLAVNEFAKADAPSHHKTPIEAYLLSRGVVLPNDCISVRYRKAWYFEGKTSRAMMALMSDPITLEPLGIHFTSLDFEKRVRRWHGAKINKWLDNNALMQRSFAANKNDRLCERHGVIMLSPSRAVKASGVLGIGEGIETTLSLRRLSGYENLSIWAAGDSGNLAKFEPPPYVKHLIIAVDNDDAGINATQELLARCQKLGVQITTIMHPDKSKDLNDLITELRKKAA